MKTSLLNPVRLSVLALIACAAALNFNPAQAATLTWTGGSNTNWNNSGNWNPATAFGSGSNAIVYAGTATNLTSNNDNAALSSTATAITFNSGAAAYTITGNQFVLGGNITNSSTNTQTISAPISTTAVRTVTMTPGGGNIILSGSITGTGGGVTALGNATLTLSSSNSYTGNTGIGTGAGQTAVVVRAEATQALGTGTIQFEGGGNASTARLELNHATGLSLSNAISFVGRGNASAGIESISGSNTLTGNITLGTGGNNYTIQSDAGLLTLTGTFTPPASGSRVLFLAGAGDGLLTGPILFVSGNTLGVTKSGAGTWTLSGNLSYTGTTTLNGGTLVLTGTNTATGPVGVNSGSTLSVASIANALGSVSAINLGGGGGIGRLLYTGTGETTNRVIGSTAGVAGAGMIIEHAGSGTLTFSSNTNFTNGASETLTFQGSTGGTGIFAGNIGTSSGGGVISLAKSGTGIWTLTGTNTYTGTTTINDGTLQLGNGGTSGSISSSGAITNNAALVVNRSDSTTLSGPISGSGSLTKQGAGTLTLGGSATYSGATTVSGGILAFPAAQSSIGSLSVADGAGLSVTAVSASLTPLTATSLALGTSGTTSLLFDFGSFNTTVPLIDSTGAFTASGTVLVTATNGGALGTGTHTLISSSGFTNTASFILTGSSFGARGVGSLTTNATSLNLSILNEIPVWSGTGGSTWTTAATSDNTSPNNWALKSAHTPTNFWAGDTVEFNDTYNSGAGNVAVTATNVVIQGSGVSATVNPSAVTFNNSAVNYVISGTTGIAGSAVVTKNGTGTVIITNSNSYTGSTVINSGTLQLGNGTTDGSINSSVSITNDGTLVYNRSTGSTFTYNNTISGTGSVVKSGSGTQILGGTNTYSGGTTVNAGTLQITTTAGAANTGTINLNGGNFQVNVSAPNFTYAPTINQTADATFSSIGAGQINYTGNLTAAGNVLNVNTGASRLYMNGSVSGVTQFNVTAGAMGFDLNVGNQGDSAPVIVSNGASLYFANASNTLTNNLTLNGTGQGGVGALFQEGTASPTISGTITLASDSSIGGSGTSGGVTVFGLITGSASLTKVGANKYTFAAANSYTGTTAINGGVVAVDNASALGGGGNITFGGGTLQYTSNNTQDYSTRIVNSTGAISIDTNSQTVTFASPLAGTNTGGLTKSGSGTLILSASNSYSGNTKVSAGILNLQNSNALGTSGTAIITDRAGGLQLEGGVSIPSSTSFMTSQDGTGAVPYAIDNVSGNNAINGTITMTTNGGFTVIQSDSGALTLAGNISPASFGPRTLILQGASTGANTVSGVISNTGTNIASVTKLGTGTWTLTGNNTYTGTTQVSDGTLAVTGTVGNTAVNVSGGTLSLQSAGAITQNTVTFSGSGSLVETVDNAIGGTTTVVAQTNITLSRPNNYSGETIINSGTSTTVTITNATGAGTARLNAATGATTPVFNLHIDGGGTITMPNSFGGNSNITTTIDVGNNGSGSNGVIQLTGTGSWGGGDTLNVTGNNGYSLAIAGIINTSGLSGSASTFNPTTANVSIGTLKGSGFAGNSFTLGGTSANNAVTGTISDGAVALSITKDNTSTWTLTGSNTYTGLTRVNGGTLNFGVSETLTGGLNIATSGTAVLTAHTGGAANVKVLDITGLTIDGTTAFVGDGGKDAGAEFISPAPVPEPGTIGLLAIGAIGGAIFSRRQKRGTK